MSKYPVTKKPRKREDKFIYEKGQFEIYKDDKKLSEKDIFKLLKDKRN